MALNDKQRRFVDEYLVDLNATQAAKRAGYSAKTAGSQGHDLLKHPEIQKAIQAGQEALSNRAKVSTDDLVEWLAEIARSKGKNDRDRIAAIKLLGDHLGAWNGEGGKQSNEPVNRPDPSVYRDMEPADLIRLYREKAASPGQV